VKPLAER